MKDEERLLLIRLEERVNVLQNEVADIKELVDKNREETKAELVTQKEFGPVKNAVYAAMGAILTAFLGLVINILFGGVLPK